MNPSTYRRGLVVLLLGVTLCLGAAGAQAQQLIIKGMYGMIASGTAPPGTLRGVFAASRSPTRSRAPTATP